MCLFAYWDLCEPYALKPLWLSTYDLHYEFKHGELN